MSTTRYVVELVSRIDSNRPRVAIDADTPEEARARARRIVGRKPYDVRILAGVALALLALATGCAGAPDIRDSYDLGIDPRFSAAEQEEVVAAADDWSARTGVELRAYVGHCDPSPDGVICVLNEFPDDESDGELGDTDPHDGRIQVDTLLAESAAGVGSHVFRTAVAHEIGHAMGCAHVGAGSLMAPVLSASVWTVQPGDVAEWYRVRGRTPPPAEK